MTTATTAWHEEQAFWETWRPYGFDAARIEAAGGEVDQIIERLQLSPASSLLDLCCGVGRHSVEFARRGFRVTGVDRDARHVQLAQEAAQQAAIAVELIQDDMRLFRRDESFDAAVSLWTSFGYFDDQAEDQAVLHNLFLSLKPYGRLLMDVAGKEVLARIFQPRGWEQHGTMILCEERRIVDDWRFIESRWIFLGDGQRREFTIKTRCYSAVELSALLAEAGFVDVAVFGDLAGAPYDHQARRLVVAARRPA